MSTRKSHWYGNICPSYKKIAQYLSLLIIVLFLWTIIYLISPKLGSPKGQLCNFIAIIFTVHISGILLYKLTTLPPLIGMLTMGILLRYLDLVDIDGDFTLVTSELKRLSVVVTLTRLGLGLDQSTIKKSFINVFKLGLVPWIVECITIAVLSKKFINLPWSWSFLLSTIVSAVSPAVPIPYFKMLRNEGYCIPKTIFASYSIDDITSVVVCCVLSSIMFNAIPPLVFTILQGPFLIICVIVYGIILGLLLKYIPKQSDQLVVTLRVMILFFGCYAASLVSYVIGYPLVGSLVTICTAFVAKCNWSEQGWEADGKPVASVFRILWIFFEPILFGLTGTQVKISELDLDVVVIGIGCIVTSMVIRFFTTIVISFGHNFNMKERLFIALSWMGKGTLQAVLGTLALDFVVKNNGTAEEIKYAKNIVTICTLSIILTAPLGASIMSIFGSKLLSKSRVAEDD